MNLYLSGHTHKDRGHSEQTVSKSYKGSCKYDYGLNIYEANSDSRTTYAGKGLDRAMTNNK